MTVPAVFSKRFCLATIMILAFCVAVPRVGASWVVEKEKEEPTSPLFKEKRKIAEADWDDDFRRTRMLQDKHRQEERRYRDEIAKHWAKVEATDNSRWVAYSQDWSMKRVVDFENNEIRIVLPKPDESQRSNPIELRKRVEVQLRELLATTMADAISQDPVTRTLAELEPDTNVQHRQLVMRELFSMDKPDERTIKLKARDMMRGSYIRYQQLAYTHAAFQPGVVMNKIAVPVKISDKLTYVIPLPADRTRKKARALKNLVEKNAERFNVSPALVMAVIHTESHFNPLARSSAPAYGLMQIVPTTAGRDASKVLFDKARVLSPQYLFDSENNVEVGTAYLNLLYYRYLGEVEHPQSRLYLTIAAYNTGTSNVARVFGGVPQMDRAIKTINTMKPEQVLKQLIKNLPTYETRNYLRKVLARRELYGRL